MRCRAVVFDLFGTLVDDFGSSAGPMHIEIASALGVPCEPFARVWNETLEARILGRFRTLEENFEHVCASLEARPGRAQIAAAVEIRMSRIRRALQPRDGAVETLGRLKAQGYRTGLVSNASIEIPLLWPETSFAGLIDAPVFSSRVGMKKPDVRIFGLACEGLGVSPELCLYVADGENYELAAASRAGLQPVLFRPPQQAADKSWRRESREWRGPVITDLTEVLELVCNR
ncbi:MAG TPA: HAD-IA family hydrolase [candidate division Zixibacteria bacterium]|nr:HAD-IA family hydrolase [candidate division Zixibacteria bacterium]